MTTFRITCAEFVVLGDTLTQALSKWAKVKHSASHSYSGVRIVMIEELKDGVTIESFAGDVCEPSA